MPKPKRKSLSADKAKKLLDEGVANGRRLTARQRRYFGLIASGGQPTKI
jgi:hypothetical protein